jgi:hypothetical protein
VSCSATEHALPLQEKWTPEDNKAAGSVYRGADSLLALQLHFLPRQKDQVLQHEARVQKLSEQRVGMRVQVCRKGSTGSKPRFAAVQSGSTLLTFYIHRRVRQKPGLKQGVGGELLKRVE